VLRWQALEILGITRGMDLHLTPRKFKARTTFFGPAPFDIDLPVTQTQALVFNSPHSGRYYPERLLRLSRLDAIDLRRSEDFYVDLLFEDAATAGAPLLKATYPRVYIDLNREPYELDPTMFYDRLPPYAKSDSDRVYSGYGSIPRVVAYDMDIYKSKLRFTKEQSRIENIHKPYHRALRDLLAKTRSMFGWAALIDCHSMPSSRSMSMLSLGRYIKAEEKDGNPNPDFVLGDRYGHSCGPELSDLIEETLTRQGYSVLRNNPYAGGYCTKHYGKPADNIHAIQIEINRSLYMDEVNLEPKVPAFERLTADMSDLVGELTGLNLGQARPLAAE